MKEKGELSQSRFRSLASCHSLHTGFTRLSLGVLYQTKYLAHMAPDELLRIPPIASAAPREPFDSPPTASTSTAPKRAASPLASLTLKKQALPQRPQPVPVRRRFVPKDFLTPDWSLAQVKG